MEDREVVQLLRLYRHDVMNQLQLINGYISMNKPEMVQEKIADYNTYIHEEQKLMNLNAHSFTLWLIFFNANHANMHITYEINLSDAKLSDVDTLLKTQCEKVFDYFNDHVPDTNYCEGHLSLGVDQETSLLKTSIAINGEFQAVDENHVKQLQGISRLQLKKTNSGMQCDFLLPLHNEVE